MKTSVLAVGTELTDGQIVNRNAAWLSRRLKAFGARCVLHLTVPDDRAAILESLEICAARSEMIFITGGLGPTSDDFTRDLVAEWSQSPMDFDESSWQALSERLTARNFPVQEMQRQQCFFPRGAVILKNSQGTANGFRFQAKNREIIVLPGPPKEIEAIWNEHLKDWLNKICRYLDPIVTHAWDLIGLGESQVAQMVEPLVAKTEFEIGYRVHPPLVEFKLSHLRSEEKKATNLVAAIEKTVAPWTIVRNGEDLAEKLTEQILKSHHEKFEINDQVTGSFLLQRINGPFRGLWAQRKWELHSGNLKIGRTPMQMWILPKDEHSVRVGRFWNQQSREIEVEAPMRSTPMSERRKQYFAERALAWWLQELSATH